MSDWRPSASVAAIRLRAQAYQQIRTFFQQRAVLEVDTPVLSEAGSTDPNLASLSLQSPPLYLQTSPEFAMKRLLAAGSGSIYQIAKAFRAGEQGRRHHIEFSMLEWYRLDFDLSQLMDEVAELVQLLLRPLPSVRISYRDLFLTELQIDPHRIPLQDLRGFCLARIDFEAQEEERDTLLELLLSHLIEPNLPKEQLTFVYDYPTSQCALAQVHEDAEGNLVAGRFELYVGGYELANGYQELADAVEQRRRFDMDNQVRAEKGLVQVPADEKLLAALDSGLPACSGVALGLDRLLMLMLGSKNIRDVLCL